MPVVWRVLIEFQADGTWLLAVEPEQGGSYRERFGRLRTAVELLPHILERFEDTTRPVEAIEGERSE